MEAYKIILAQLGGAKFVAMTGAKSLLQGDGGKMLSFRIGRNASGFNHVAITLNWKDLYDMTFSKIRGTKVKSEEVGDVYEDQLQDIFTAKTGLLTSL